MPVCDKFLTDLVLLPHRGQGVWRLGAPFVFESEHAGRIEVPADFVTDLNSLPRVLWIVGPPSHYPRSAVLHDYAYFTAMPRATADAMYREALECEGAGRPRRWVRWTALRLFGWWPHRQHRKRIEAQASQEVARVHADLERVDLQKKTDEE